MSGRAFLYEGVEAPNHAAVSAVRGIIDRSCGGSVEELLVGMVENDVVDGADLKRPAGKIAAKKRK